MAIIFFIVAAYLYQYDCWARQAAKSTKPTKVRSPLPRKPQPPVEPIEQQLNQLSAEFGMISMRQVRKQPVAKPQNSTSEKPEG